MYFSSINVVALALAGLNYVRAGDVLERAACNRDNCLRQIVASAFPGGPARGSADCSLFMTTTLTPCATTTTIAAINTGPPGDGQVSGNVKRSFNEIIAKRVVADCKPTLTSSTSIPVYASSCHAPTQFASACACDGIAAETITLAVPTVTVTATANAPGSGVANSNCPVTPGDIADLNCAGGSSCTPNVVCLQGDSKDACRLDCDEVESCVGLGYDVPSGQCLFYENCCPV